MTFTIEEPTTVDEAITLLSEGDESTRVVAGGTGLALLMRYGFFEPTTLISLRRLAPELSRIEVEPGGTVRLGAMATLRDLEDSDVVAQRLPLLRDALDVLATIRLRNVARLGGAIAHGHPQMDTPPVLLALDAEVHVVSTRGARSIPAAELFLGYYETAVEDDELITEVMIAPKTGKAAYRKVTARAVDDWPMLGIAAQAQLRDGRLAEIAVALGALTDRAQRLTAMEQALQGAQATPELLAEAAAAGADEVEYHDKPVASAAFQRHLVQVHLRRTLAEVVSNGTQGGK